MNDKLARALFSTRGGNSILTTATKSTVIPKNGVWLPLEGDLRQPARRPRFIHVKERVVGERREAVWETPTAMACLEILDFPKGIW